MFRTINLIVNESVNNLALVVVIKLFKIRNVYLDLFFTQLCFNVFNRYFVSSFWDSCIFCPGEFLVCQIDFTCLFHFINLKLDNPCLCHVADISRELC